MEQQLAFRVQRKWRCVCVSCGMPFIGIMEVGLASGDGDPPPIETLAAMISEHIGAGVAGVVQRGHAIEMRTYWVATP